VLLGSLGFARVAENRLKKASTRAGLAAWR